MIAAKSVKNLFWRPKSPTHCHTNEGPSDIEIQYAIEKDIGALCYTFAMLLYLASTNAIVKRKEEVRKFTSEILRILEEEEEELALNMRQRTVYNQIQWAAESFDTIRSGICGDTVDGGLVRKLEELREQGDEWFPETPGAASDV